MKRIVGFLLGLLVFSLAPTAGAQCLVKYGAAGTIQGIPLIDSASSSNAYKVNPTLASGDVKISIDGGTENNLNTLPDAEPNGSSLVRVILSASAPAETTGKVLTITFHDSAGAEWNDRRIICYTYGHANAYYVTDWSNGANQGMTGIPTAAPGTTGGVLCYGTGTGCVNPTTGRVPADLQAWLGGTPAALCEGDLVCAQGTTLGDQAKVDVAVASNIFRAGQTIAAYPFEFRLIDGGGPATGLTVTCTRSLNDGLTWSATTTATATETSDGWYTIPLNATDMNVTPGKAVLLRCDGGATVNRYRATIWTAP